MALQNLFDAFLTAIPTNTNHLSSAAGNTGSLSVFSPLISSVNFGSAGSFTFGNVVIETIDVAGGGFGPGEAATPVPAALPVMATAIVGVAYLGSSRRK